MFMVDYFFFHGEQLIIIVINLRGQLTSYQEAGDQAPENPKINPPNVLLAVLK
jgi:hypothetical protein